MLNRATLLLTLILIGPRPAASQSVDCRPPPFLAVLVDQTLEMDPVCAEESGHAYAYQWNAGDASGDRPWSAASRLTVAYSQAGSFTAILKVRVDSVWLPANTFSVAIRVRTPVTTRPPVHSTPLAYDPVRGRTWNVNTDAGTITETDPKAGICLREIPVGKKPQTLGLDSGGNVWVTVREPASVVRVDREAGTVERIPLPRGSLPFGIVLDPVARRAYVSLEGTGKVVRLDLGGAGIAAVSASGEVFPAPRALALSHDGRRLFVARFHTRVRHDLPPDSSFGEVAELSPADLTVTRRLPLAYDRSSDSRLSGSGVLTQIRSLAIHPDGKTAWLTATKANVFRGRFRSGTDFDPNGENSLRSVVAVLDLEAGREDLAKRFDVDDSGMPSALVFSADGIHAYLATQGTNSVEILDGATLQDHGTIGPFHSGSHLAPDGLALSPDDSLLCVHNFTTRTLGVYDRTRPGPTGGLLLLHTVPLVSRESLTPRQLHGLQVFYNSADPRITKSGYIGCAACHLGGGSDRLIWDFTQRGEGLRKTIPMNGRAGTAHGPVHWSANFDEIQDFEHDIRGPFGGTGLMADALFHQGSRDRTLGDPKAGQSEDLDALADYVSTLADFDASPYRNPDGSLTSEAEAGRALFQRQDVGCAKCHAGPNFTDSDLRNRPFLLHDVGTLTSASGKRMNDTLTGLDTPTLLGIWQYPPYLHDGSAPTLMDVLATRNREDRHGKTSHLSETERRQLVAYLLQLEGPGDAPGAVPAPRGGPLGPQIKVVRSSGGMELRFAFPGGPPGLELRLQDIRGGEIARLAAVRRSGGYRAWWGGAGRDPGGVLLYRLLEGERLLRSGKVILLP